MKSSMTLSTLMLSFVIHAVFTNRLRSASKMILGECYVDDKPLNCKFHDFTMVDTSDLNKWCCLKYVYESERTEIRNENEDGGPEFEFSSSSVIKDSKDSELSVVTTTTSSSDNEISNATSSASPDNDESASSNEMRKLNSEKVFGEIKSGSIPSESSSELSEAATTPITSSASESLSFEYKGLNSDDDGRESNDLTLESSRLLSVLSSSSNELPVASTTVDLISLTTTAASSSSPITSTSAEVRNMQPAATNVEKPPSVSLSPSIVTTRRRLPERKLSRRARINKTNSSAVIESYSSSSSSVNSAGVQETSEQLVESLHLSTSTFSREESQRSHQTTNASASGVQDTLPQSSIQIQNAESISESSELLESETSNQSKEELHERSVALSSTEGVGSHGNVVLTKEMSSIEFSTQTMLLQDSAPERVKDEVLREAVSSIEEIPIYSSELEGLPLQQLEVSEEFDGKISSEQTEKSSDALDSLTASQLHSFSAEKTKNLAELISSLPSREDVAESPESLGAASSEIEKLSSAAESVLPSIQTFQTRRGLTTSGQDTSDTLSETAEDSRRSEGFDDSEDDEADEDVDGELDNDEDTVREHRPKPKLKHPPVPNAFNKNEFESSNFENDPFVAERPNKQRAKAPILRLSLSRSERPSE